MTTIATICARAGSKGVPGKNLHPVEGKPLIVHTIEQAQACPEIEEVYFSTDDQEIAEVARQAGAVVPFLRPAELAADDTPKVPVLRHLVDWVGNSGKAVETIVDLDPTSPLREIEDIQACLRLLDDGTDLVITGYPAEKNPYFNMVEQQADGYYQLVKPLPEGVAGRQLAPQVYSMNASVYVWRLETLMNRDDLWSGGRVKLHVMPRERSIDIDEPLDMQLVKLLMREKHGAKQDAL